MHTTISFTFRAHPVGEPIQEGWVTSAGRWETLLEAIKAANEWLLHMDGESPQQYAIEITQVEELELLNG